VILGQFVSQEGELTRVRPEVRHRCFQSGHPNRLAEQREPGVGGENPTWRLDEVRPNKGKGPDDKGFKPLAWTSLE
jgi:hypothetical protein